jgi:hypothetical protein
MNYYKNIANEVSSLKSQPIPKEAKTRNDGGEQFGGLENSINHYNNGNTMTISIDYSKTPEMVTERLPAWIKELQNAFIKDYAERDIAWLTPKIYIAGGRKYIKIAKSGRADTSVYCFVRAEDGAILKAASWKKPALNFKRGTIFDSKTPNTYGL